MKKIIALFTALLLMGWSLDVAGPSPAKWPTPGRLCTIRRRVSQRLR